MAHFYFAIQSNLRNKAIGPFLKFSAPDIGIPHNITFRNMKNPNWNEPVGVPVLALPIFPGRCQPSIVGADELNFCVRNGNRWTLTAISTNSISSSTSVLDFVTIPHFPYFVNGDPYRIRTDVNGVRGRCLNHLTNGPWCAIGDSNPGPTD